MPDEREAIVFINPWSGIIGPNVGMQQLCREMLGRGLAVHVFCPTADEFTARLTDAGVVVHVDDRVRVTPRTRNPVVILRDLARSGRLVRRVADAARKSRAGAICVNSENMLLAARAGKLAGCRSVVIMRGFRFPELGLLGRVFFGLQQRWVDRYVAIIDLGARALAAMGVPPGKIVTISNGVDTDVYRPDAKPPELLAELGMPAGEPVIGTLAHLTPRKGVQYLIEALVILRRRGRVVRCVIVGGVSPSDADFADSLRRRIGELGLGQSVALLGYRSDTPRLHNLFDLYVQPSETEACPRSVIEAQSCGRPVLGFQVGGMPEVVADGETGFLAKPFDVEELADSIQRLLDDHALRNKMGRTARQRVLDRYDLKANLSRLADEIVASGGGAGRVSRNGRHE